MDEPSNCRSHGAVVRAAPDGKGRIRTHRATSRGLSRAGRLVEPLERRALSSSVASRLHLARSAGRRESHRRRVDRAARIHVVNVAVRSEEHTSELQSLMRISYAVFCLKKKKT